ncbi:MAG TPA: hypothetical protein VGF34_00915 [Stellaceae bacterium]|jgi:hypothetical protein
MTLLEVEELIGYWTEHPPLHITVAAYLGFDRAGRLSRQIRAASPRNGDPASLLAELGPGFGSGDVHAGLASVVLDFAALKRNA